MFGGSGSGLLVMMAILAAPRTAPLVLAFVALALVGFGLLMVWFEIGRPWRFLHVFFHPQTSWMTREGSVGIVLFVVTLAGGLMHSVTMMSFAAILGLVFLYCQARILKAAAGIPAWREPVIVPLITVSGLVEGTAIVVMFFHAMNATAPWMLGLFVILVIARLWIWCAYRNALARSKAPAGTLQAFTKLHREFFIAGFLLPILFVLTSFVLELAIWATYLAGVFALVSGWRMKYILVVKASFKQGYGIGKLRRGRPVVKSPERREGDPIQF